MNQVPKVLQFTCPNCSIPLTVPESMAGITGPCPSCQTPVTAPELVQIGSPKTQLRPPFLVAALVASGLGLAWSVYQHQGGNSTKEIVQATAPAVPVTPEVAAVERSKKVVHEFLQAPDWPTARKLVDERDITGTISEPAFRPAQFQRLAQQAEWTPVKVQPNGAEGQYQIVWQIDVPQESLRLMLTADDTAAGPRVRWFKPPAFVPVVGGTNANRLPKRPDEIAAELAANQPQPAPPPPAMEPAAPVMQETILAATEAAPTSSGAAPLLNAGAKPAEPASSTAANTPAPKPEVEEKPKSPN